MSILYDTLCIYMRFSERKLKYFLNPIESPLWKKKLTHAEQRNSIGKSKNRNEEDVFKRSRLLENFIIQMTYFHVSVDIKFLG